MCVGERAPKSPGIYHIYVCQKGTDSYMCVERVQVHICVLKGFPYMCAKRVQIHIYVSKGSRFIYTCVGGALNHMSW